MRLLRSDDPEITSCLSSRHPLVVRGRAPMFHGFLGNLAIVAAVFAAQGHASITTPIGIGIFLVWNLILIWRALFGLQGWVLLGSQERLYVRLFSLQGRARRSPEPCVIAIEIAEVSSVSVQSRKVFVRGPKPTVYEWLAIEPDAAAKSLLAGQSEQLAPIGET